MEPVGAPSRDVISEALGAFSVRSSVFCLSELRSPWGFGVQGAGIPKFHLLLAGSAWLLLDDHDPIRLEAGDLVLLPRGHAHTVCDEPGSPVTDLDRILEDNPLQGNMRLRHGGSGDLTRLLCGGFVLTDSGPTAALTVLPDVIRVDAQSVAATTWLAPMLEMLEMEVTDGDLGAGAVQDKIADVFLTQALRCWLAAGERTGALPSILLSRDELVAEAVSMVRDSLSTKWTIERLASTVGISRTAFVTRFRREVGVSPMRYVARLRMSTAAGLLATSQLSLREIAFATGYDSEASLSKAFKRELGQSPAAYRAGFRSSKFARSAISPQSVG